MTGLSLSAANAVLKADYGPAVSAQMDMTANLLWATLDPAVHGTREAPMFGPWEHLSLEPTLESVRGSLYMAADEYLNVEGYEFEAAPASFVVKQNGHRFRVTVEPA